MTVPEGSPGSDRGASRLNPYDLATWRGEAARDSDVVDLNEDRQLDASPIDFRADDETESGEDRGQGEAEYDPPELQRTASDPFELARRTVNRSRASARDRGLFPTSRATRMREARDRSSRAPGFSGARPDPRDPQSIDSVLRRVLDNLGWNEGLSSGKVLEDWEEIVGDQIAAHCSPVTLDEGVLVISASSSAWASQMRMLSSQIITRIHEHVGREVISELKVTGPAGRSWKKGKRTVTWRGPRDTYG
ncbi:MAG: DciA family protein, partial [Brachybacterium sp.]|nr:DciA family protein [Brachybacterium sp.]